VIKYWQLDEKEIIENELYPLLPLQLYMQRSRLDKLDEHSEEDKAEMVEILHQMYDTAIRIAAQSRELLKAAKISDADVGKLVNAIEYLYLYLNDRYVHVKETKEEITSMLKNLFSDKWLDAIMRAEEAEKEAQVAKENAAAVAAAAAAAAVEEKKKIFVLNFLRKGVSVEIIAESLGLTEAEVMELKNTL
jgi:hypothetical protein